MFKGTWSILERYICQQIREIRDTYTKGTDHARLANTGRVRLSRPWLRELRAIESNTGSGDGCDIL
jgi:hypothetical protein